jgi:hypothetical protein
MQKYNIRGDNYTYSKLILLLIKVNLDDACMVCQDAFANKIILNDETYNMLLYKCAYSESADLMRYGANISDQMRQIGLHCDKYIQEKLVITLASETYNKFNNYKNLNKIKNDDYQESK